MATRRWFWPAVAVQILILFGMIGSHAYTVKTGVAVKLKAESFNPWETIQGDTVRLTYGISRLDPATVPVQGTGFKPGREIWVLLAPGDGTSALAIAASATRPPIVKPGQVAIRGVVEWVNSAEPEPIPPEKLPPPGTTPPEYKPVPPGAISVRYGVEQFTLPEGVGRDTPRPMSDFTVEIAVDRFGRAALTRVFLDGREVQWR